MMPGFTAPKLLWVAGTSRRCFARTARVLLPKDLAAPQVDRREGQRHVRCVRHARGSMSGERDWSDAMLAATGLTRAHMPRLVRAGGLGSAAPRQPDAAGASPGCRWPAAAATTRRAPSGGRRAARGRRSCRWAPRACCSWSTDRFRPESRACRPCVLPLPAQSLAPDVGDVDGGERSGLGGAADRRDGSAAAGRSRAGARPRSGNRRSSCRICPESARRTTIPMRAACSLVSRTRHMPPI